MKRFPVLIAGVAASLLFTASPAAEKVQSNLLKAPLATAQKTKKIVFVSFSASWCGPCRLLHKTLEHAPVKPIWDKYFVSVPLVVEEHGDEEKLNTPGGNELRKALHGDQAGIPFFAFLQPDGTVVTNSYMDGKNGNMGCPMSPEEIASFMKKLAQVAPNMTAAERKTIETAFKTAKM